MFQVGLFVGAGLRVFLLDFADRRDDPIVAQGLHRQVETHLVIAHAGAAVRNLARSQFVAALQGGFDNEVTIRHQQRVLALVALACPDERLHEAVPEGGTAIDSDVAGNAKLGGAALDEGALFGIDAAGVGEHGVHRVAALAQVGNAEAGVQAACEGQHDVFLVGHVGSVGVSLQQQARP